MDPPGDGSAGKPPGWRAEWREPKKRRGERREGSRARARVVGLAPVPSREELQQRGVRVLLEIAEDEEAQTAARVGAAAKIVELATRGKVGGGDLDGLSDEELEAKGRELAKRWLGAGEKS